MTLQYRKRVGPITVVSGTVTIHPVLNVVLFGYPKRRARRELETAGFEVLEAPARPGAEAA